MATVSPDGIIPRLSTLARNTAIGSLLGALLGVLFIGVGIVRALIVLLTGHKVAALSSADWRLLGFYIGGFALAGGLLGMARPLLRGRVAISLGCMAAGVIVVLAIAAGDKGLAGLDRTDWIALPVMGAAFGGALAYGFLREPR